MATKKEEQTRRILADIERRLLNGENLDTQQFEQALKDAGDSYQEAKRRIIKHGSSYLLRKYKESFGPTPPAELNHV